MSATRFPTTRDSSPSFATLSPTPFLSLADYKRLFANLDADARAKIVAAWGAPDDDPSVRDGHFTMRFARHGRLIAAIQPDRGNALDRKASYHDPDLPPRHAYVAFYLWLREVERIHAHDPSRHARHARMAAGQGHGAVVVLPARGAARRAAGDLSLHRQQSGRGGCRQAQARRGDHRPSDAAAEIGRPRQRHAGARAPDRRIRRRRRARPPPHARCCARRFSTAPRPRDCSPRAAPTARSSKEDQLARLDAYLCDVKDLQIRDGLACLWPRARRRNAAKSSSPRWRSPILAVAAETLAARFDQAAASASARRCSPRSTANSWRQVRPARRRAAAPTFCPPGRNLYAIDPRAVPTRSARRARREGRQGTAAPPPAGSRRMAARAGDGCVGQRHHAHRRRGSCARASAHGRAARLGSGLGPRQRHSRFCRIAELDHPRVDVTLRISGLFRDAFEAQIALFDEAVRAIAARDEPDDWNPLAASVRGLERRRLAARHRAHLWRRARRLRSRRHRARRARRLGHSAPISASIISPPRRPPTAKASTAWPTATASPRA